VIAATTYASQGKKIRAGIGDDAAIWKPARNAESVITTDALVEDVHFLRDGMSAADVGWRALVSNLSDLAAVGARPVLATVALGVPRGVHEAWILDCYRGMAELAKKSRIAIVGGDVVRAPSLLLSITAIGEVRPSHRKMRNGARPGDILAVTGPLGASRAGIDVLLDGARVDDARCADAIAAYRRPHARLAEGRRFGASTNVHAMMDISDGLSTDLRRLCMASNVGAEIDAAALPVAPCAVPVAQAFGKEPLSYALGGGEDFELLVAIAPRAFPTIAKRFESTFGRPLSRVGTITAHVAVRLRDPSGTRELVPTGWDSLG